jgi:hypothetical protein
MLVCTTKEIKVVVSMKNVILKDAQSIYSKVQYFIMGAHLLCTNYIYNLLLKLKILNQVPNVHINGFMTC